MNTRALDRGQTLTSIELRAAAREAIAAMPIVILARALATAFTGNGPTVRRALPVRQAA